MDLSDTHHRKVFGQESHAQEAIDVGDNELGVELGAEDLVMVSQSHRQAQFALAQFALVGNGEQKWGITIFQLYAVNLSYRHAIRNLKANI